MIRSQASRTTVVGVKSKRSLRSFACPYRLFNGCEAAQKMRPLVPCDCCLPHSFAGVDAHMARCVVRRSARISHVLGMRGVAQILQSVVERIAVDVVNHIRLFIVNHLPDHSMSFVMRCKDGAVQAASITGCECTPSCVFAVPPTGLRRRLEKLWRTLPPKQTARLRVIFEQLAEKVCLGQILRSHRNLHNRFRGQGRALLTQRFRPVSYGRFTIRSQPVGQFLTWLHGKTGEWAR